MGILNFINRKKTRADPRRRSMICYTDASGFEDCTCDGYTSLSQNPEIVAAVNTIARLIGSMTIQLMENAEDGDVRVLNELSRKVDINPNSKMTRSGFIQWIVSTMLLSGDGNAVVYPRTERGLLLDLEPIPSAYVSFIPDGEWSYKVIIAGREFDPDDVLHFRVNPENYYPWLGSGYQVALGDIANNLKQATQTENGFMRSNWKPSLIIKVDAMTEELQSPAARSQIVHNYVETVNAGEPWVLPADHMTVEQVKPLTLSDLALADFVQLDKKTVAAILGVPPFVLGVGDFDRDAWNNFINTTIMPIAREMEQELTKKLLLNRNWFFRFNSWSLFSYSVTELVSAGAEMVDRMAMTRNEWRSWMNLPPRADMNELLALENYIPADRLGDQSKLLPNGGDNE